MVEGKDIVKFELLADSIKKINNKAGNAAKSAVNQLLTLGQFTSTTAIYSSATPICTLYAGRS